VIEGGGGLSTICGFGFIKREKKLAHISTRFFIVNPYKFRFFLALMKWASVDSVHTRTRKIFLSIKDICLRASPRQGGQGVF
jgi:hypothetical protein